ncbi:MAG: GMC family oxidoreductase [Sphingobacteriales bacterium]|nr:MAG: GMC family oxidoreductase [Sphingobacteriales bacterium]
MPQPLTKAKQQNTYDAIVVGSGISGGWAAKELCEKGLKVLMLERGRMVEHPKDYITTNKSLWEFEHRLNLSIDDKQTHPIQSRHWSFREDNKHFYINDQQNPYEEKQRFDWIRGDVVGGRSLLWSRATYRWSDLDFEANLKDGHGVDWPIRYKDIAPWYDYVERFIGVSGSKENIPQLPDGIFQPPFEMNAVEKHFKQQIESHYPDRKVIMGRSANLTAPVKDRGLCQSRNLCHRGCPWGAYFSTNASTMPAAFATGNLTLKSGALVNKVLYNEATQRAEGVEVIHTDTRQTETFYAKLIFLNASTVATAFILLNSVSNRFPNGLGNGSDQVGRNLMDHHKGLGFEAGVEGFADSYYSGYRPVPLYIPRFENVKESNPHFVRGYHYGASAYRPRQSNGAPLGEELKQALSEPGDWRIGLYAFGECLPYSDNRITLSKDKQDPWGRPQVVMDCSFKENEHRMHEQIKTNGLEMLEAAGYKNPQVSGSISYPGNANHEMGIARMGRDAKTSVLNAFNQMHEVPNVFITDGSCMTSSSCVNPSLTYMALTARACDYAVTALKKGEL